MEKLLSEHEGRQIHINPHCFRHSRITNLTKSGVPLEKVSSYVNHKSLDITKSYLPDSGEEDAADILGINIDGKVAVKEEPPKPIEPKPVAAPVPVMVDRTDRKSIRMMKKPKKYEQMALF
jgi:hypothetical protein